MLPPGGGNAATGRWQCCHWAVYDGIMVMKRRNSLCIDVVIKQSGDRLLQGWDMFFTRGIENLLAVIESSC